MSFNILVIDKSSLFTQKISEILKRNKFDNFMHATNLEIAGNILGAKKTNLAVVDADILQDQDKMRFNKLFTNNRCAVLITVSSDTKNSDQIVKLLEMGAVDFIVKPKIYLDDSSFEKELVEKINSLSNVNINVPSFNYIPQSSYKLNTKIKKSDEAIVIATSTGGPRTLEQVIPLFPKELPIPIFVVQHMPPVFTKALAERLNSISDLKVKEAEDGEDVQPGICFIAPGDFHMRVVEDAGLKKIKLSKEDKQLGVRPNANILMESVAKIYKGRTIAIVLTGMGNDGTEGSRLIKKVEGTVLVEAEEDCVIFGMPKAVINSGYYDLIVPLDKITVQVLQLIDI